MKDQKRPKLLVNKTEASEKIRNRIDIGKKLLETSVNSENELKNLGHETEKWSDYNIMLFKTLFSETPLSPWTHGNKMVRVAYRENQVYHGTEEHKRYLDGWVNDLESIHERLELYEETTLIGEKLYHAKTKVITKIKGLTKKHLLPTLGAIIASIIAGIILFYIGC